MAPVALRAGESFAPVAPDFDYTPSAQTGTDDYHCFLLDPRLSQDTNVTGFEIVPGEASVVHHVILFRVPPEEVARAQARNAQAGGQGWTCFGGTGLQSQGSQLDDAQWVGAWAPGGTERVLAADLGTPLERGSMLVMQVHYNLLRGTAPDRSAVKLRLNPSQKLTPIRTQLFVAPVELPCRAGKSGPLCDRTRAVFDVQKRFGEDEGRLIAGLLMICQNDFEPHPGNTQTCTRKVQHPATVVAAAGHMHLLGSSISVVLNKGRANEKVLLDLPVWDFDDQGSRPTERTPIGPGDEITVSCTHDQSWRDRLPALEGIPERYVVWGEGTTDEMCLGILSVID